jgi:hypothetical protein
MRTALYQRSAWRQDLITYFGQEDRPTVFETSMRTAPLHMGTSGMNKGNIRVRTSRQHIITELEAEDSTLSQSWTMRTANCHRVKAEDSTLSQTCMMRTASNQKWRAPRQHNISSDTTATITEIRHQVSTRSLSPDIRAFIIEVRSDMRREPCDNRTATCHWVRTWEQHFVTKVRHEDSTLSQS